MLAAVAKHLMGASEIQERLRVSRQRVQQLVARPDWPPPYDELAMGKVWRKGDIEAWIAAHRPEVAHADEDDDRDNPAGE